MNRLDPADDLAASVEAGWFNDAGTPAPGPENFPRTGDPKPTTPPPNPETHPSRQPIEESHDYTTSRDLPCVTETGLAKRSRL